MSDRPGKSAVAIFAGLIGGLIGALAIWFILKPAPMVVILREPATERTPDGARAAQPSSEQSRNGARANPLEGDKTSAVAGRPSHRVSQIFPSSDRGIQPPPAARAEETNPSRAAATDASSSGAMTAIAGSASQLVVVSRTDVSVRPGINPSAAELRADRIGTAEALAFALEAAAPFVDEGFVVREDFLGGVLPVNGQKAIAQQLFKGNEYWFWMGADRESATISVRVFDSNGGAAEAEHWEKPHLAAVRVVPKETGAYYVIVEVKKSDRERTAWALAYGFR